MLLCRCALMRRRAVVEPGWHGPSPSSRQRRARHGHPVIRAQRQLSSPHRFNRYPFSAQLHSISFAHPAKSSRSSAGGVSTGSGAGWCRSRWRGDPHTQPAEPRRPKSAQSRTGIDQVVRITHRRCADWGQPTGRHATRRRPRHAAAPNISLLAIDASSGQNQAPGRRPGAQCQLATSHEPRPVGSRRDADSATRLRILSASRSGDAACRSQWARPSSTRSAMPH